MKHQDHIDDYLESRSRMFNFLGSVAEKYPENSYEHNIIKLACHAILFCHSRGGHEAFKEFINNDNLTNDERKFFDDIGFKKT